MIPKTEIIYSWIYNREWNRDKTVKVSNELFSKLKEDCKEFERLYRKHISKILKLIPSHTKKEWKKEHIPIYIVNKKGSSFHSPLTLKFHKDAKRMFFVFLHELIHNNIDNHGFKAEDKINKLSEKIMKKLGI